jgi:D-glycero-D-manno-heptose 1,7-bisphosphate phosphatase
MVKAVFLDRDGVINANLERDGKPVAPTTLDDFRIFPDAPQAVRRLKDAGFLLIVVTNQPDVRTGLTSKATMETMHERIRAAMPIDDFEICFHVNADNCACRKPKPGLLLQATAKHNIDLSKSIMIGDRWRDILAGQAAGCAQTIRIDHGLVEEQQSTPDAVVKSLSDATDLILSDVI